ASRIQGFAATGFPSRNLICWVTQAPPGTPLRNGATLSLISSPGLSEVRVQPSRARALGLTPSRAQTSVVPSSCLTSRMMNVCGAELDGRGQRGGAGHATSERRDPQLDLVTGPERGPRPAFPREGARAYAFEGPDLGGSVLLLDLQNDERVRGDEPEFLHHAFEIDLVVLVKHREGVVRGCVIAGGEKHGGQSRYDQSQSHAIPLDRSGPARNANRRRRCERNANVTK